MRMWLLGGIVHLGGQLWRQLSQIERGEVRLGRVRNLYSFLHSPWSQNGQWESSGSPPLADRWAGLLEPEASRSVSGQTPWSCISPLPLCSETLFRQAFLISTCSVALSPKQLLSFGP